MDQRANCLRLFLYVCVCVCGCVSLCVGVCVCGHLQVYLFLSVNLSAPKNPISQRVTDTSTVWTHFFTYSLWLRGNVEKNDVICWTGIICCQIYRNVLVFHSKWCKEEKYKRGSVPNAKCNLIF